MAEMKNKLVSLEDLKVKHDYDERNYATKNEVNVERERISSLMALGQGSTTGDAELQDIRLAFDGTRYTTAGQAVRGQFSQAVFWEETDEPEFDDFNAKNVVLENGNNVEDEVNLISRDINNLETNLFSETEYTLGNKANYTSGIDITTSAFLYNNNGKIVVVKPTDLIIYEAHNYRESPLKMLVLKYNETLTFDVIEVIEFTAGKHKYKNNYKFPICVAFLQSENYAIRTTENTQNTVIQDTIQSLSYSGESTIEFFRPNMKKRYFSLSMNIFHYTDNSLSVSNVPVDSKVVGNIFNENKIAKYTYVVDKNGYGDYISLYECLNDIKNITEYKIVHINEGVYDLYEEMGGDNYFSNINTNTQTEYDVQPWLSNIKIIGHGNVEINLFIPNSIPQNIYWLFSNLNFRGNCWLENVELNSSHNRYCIHDESGTNYPNTVHVYKNVRMNKNEYSVCLGCGFSKCSTVIIEDCELNGDLGGGYSHHSKGGLNLTIKNSIFKTNSTNESIRFSTESNAKDNIIVDNCYIKSAIMVRPEWQFTNAISNMKIDIKNSYIPRLLKEYNGIKFDSFVEKITSYNTITGEVVNLTPTN